MTFDALVWVFALAVTIHNLEEAVWLPAWSRRAWRRVEEAAVLPAWLRRAGRRRAAVGAGEFRFGVFALTLLVIVVAALAAAGSAVAAYLVCGFALGMALNAFVPHLAASAALRDYAPGTASGIFLVLPVAAATLFEAGAEGRIAWPTFAWAGPATILAIVAAIPLLFALARAWRGLRGGRQSC
jgi:hypothetical protein